MKRFLIMFMILGLTVGSVATAEAKGKPRRVVRTVHGSYGPYPAPVTGCNSALGTFACLIIPTRRAEAFLTARAADTHGLPVFVEVRSGGHRIGTFCGKTSSPIRFEPGAQLEFLVALPVWGIQLECPANSVKTVGTISVTLSNLP